MLSYVIERFEGDVAVLEDCESCKRIEVDRCTLPRTAKEGDVVEEHNGSYSVNYKATDERRSLAIAKLRKLGL